MPKKVKRKKARVLWAVCEMCGGEAGDVEFVRDTKRDALEVIESFRHVGWFKVVKFVECLT